MEEVKRTRVIVTGSIAFDYLMQFSGLFSDSLIPEKLETISVSFLVQSLKKQWGGCAGNIAYSLALLGERPLVVATAGKDFEEYRAFLERAGVDTSGIRIFQEEFTASFFANTDRKGNQICSFYTGAMRFAKSHPIDFFLTNRPLVIISPNDPEAMILHVQTCQANRISYIYDPGQQVVCLEKEDLMQGIHGATVLIANEYEFELLKKKTGLNEAQLVDSVSVLVVTLGESGSIFLTKDRKIQIPIARPLRVLDPTGGGDAFRAGLMKGMLLGLDWEIIGRMGSVAAAYVIETEGPQAHTYTFSEFYQRYKENFGSCEELKKRLMLS